MRLVDDPVILAVCTLAILSQHTTQDMHRHTTTTAPSPSSPSTPSPPPPPPPSQLQSVSHCTANSAFSFVCLLLPVCFCCVAGFNILFGLYHLPRHFAIHFFLLCLSVLSSQCATIFFLGFSLSSSELFTSKLTLTMWTSILSHTLEAN